MYPGLIKRGQGTPHTTSYSILVRRQGKRAYIVHVDAPQGEVELVGEINRVGDNLA